MESEQLRELGSAAGHREAVHYVAYRGVEWHGELDQWDSHGVAWLTIESAGRYLRAAYSDGREVGTWHFAHSD